MSDYDPRSETGIPTEPVGSLPRPSTLQAAYAAYDKGEIDKAALEKEQDAAVEDSIKHLEATGSPIISDGEQRWSSFATYALADTLAGTGLADNLAGGGQFFAIFADGHDRQLPEAHRRPVPLQDVRRRHAEAVDRLRPQADEAGGDRPVDAGAAVPARGGGRRATRATSSRRTWSTSARRTSARPSPPVPSASRSTSPRAGWPPGPIPATRGPARGCSRTSSSSTTGSWPASRAEERRNIGIHTCPGGDRDSVHSADVPYNNLLPEMFKINAGYFLIQLASERDKDPVYESIGQHSRDDADGVAQMCFVGVINPQNPRVESAEEVRDALVRAANFIPKERLGSTDDCGFSPFSIDEKPNHGSPDYAREVAFQKIANRVEGTKMAAEKLGVS